MDKVADPFPPYNKTTSFKASFFNLAGVDSFFKNKIAAFRDTLLFQIGFSKDNFR